MDFEKIHEYTFKKNSLKVVRLFRTFPEVLISKIIISTHSKKFFEVVQLVSKIFLGVNLKNNHEYTFEKKIL